MYLFNTFLSFLSPINIFIVYTFNKTLEVPKQEKTEKFNCFFLGWKKISWERNLERNRAWTCVRLQTQSWSEVNIPPPGPPPLKKIKDVRWTRSLDWSRLGSGRTKLGTKRIKGWGVIHSKFKSTKLKGKFYIHCLPNVFLRPPTHTSYYAPE